METEFFFNSRVDTGVEPGPVDSDIFFVERDGSGWSAPINIGPPVNTKGQEVSLCLSRRGTLFFQGNYDTGLGSSDLYASEFVDGAYQTPVNLGPAVNSPHIEISPAVSPDESFLLFVSSQPGGHFRTSAFSLEVFVSFKKEDGSWTKAKNLGKEVNALAPSRVSLSPDGKYFFFYSSREKEFYWASTDLIARIRSEIIMER